MKAFMTMIAGAALAALVFGSTAASADTGSSGRAFSGPWEFSGTIDLLSVDPGAQRFIGRPLAFGHGKVAGPFPFGCEEARYELLSVPPQGLFVGLVEAENPVLVAERFDVPMEVETLRVTCEIGTFDYHRAGTRLLTVLDGVVHVLTRPREL